MSDNVNTQLCRGLTDDKHCSCGIIVTPDYKSFFDSNLNCISCHHILGLHWMPRPYSTPAVSKEKSSPPRAICEIVVNDAFRLAAELSCRTAIEKFANEAGRLHDLEVASCTVRLGDHAMSTTAKLTHFEYCAELAREAGHVFDKHHDIKLQSSVHPPTNGTLKDIFIRIHNSQILRTQDGKAVVLYDLPAVEKRLLVRTLMCQGDDVVIFDGTCVRPPHDDEIHTPPKCATSSPVEVKGPSPQTPIQSPNKRARPT